MAATMRIDQAGLPAGVNGRARLDGVSTDQGDGMGPLVTLTSVSPPGGATSEFFLDSVPAEDSHALGNLTQLGAHVWTFRPTAGVRARRYRIRLRVTLTTGSVEESTHTFGIPDPLTGLVAPAFNERGVRTATEADVLDSDVIAATESNEGGTIRGYHDDWQVALTEKVIELAESSGVFDTLHETIGAQTVVARSYVTSAAQTGEDTLIAWNAAVRAYDPVTEDFAQWEMLVAAKRVAGVVTVLSLQFLNGPLKVGTCTGLDVTVTVSGVTLRLNVVGVVGVDARWSVSAETPKLVRDLDFP